MVLQDGTGAEGLYQSICIYERCIYLLKDNYRYVSLLTEAMVNVVENKQEERSDNFPRLNSILWDILQVTKCIKNIFIRGTYIGMHAR